MTGLPVKVTISYCAECGYEEHTVALARALMIRFQHRLSSIEIFPADSGAFDVRVGGDLVHSMYRDGGFPDCATIARAVEAKLGG